MFNLGPYAEFIIACYAISLITLAALTIWVNRQESHYKKRLAMIEENKDQEGSA